MQVTKYRIQDLWTIILIVVGVLVWLPISGDLASAGYADSAHGDTSSGVNRSGAECPIGTPCPKGDCAQCHDTFSESTCGVNPYMLFDPASDENFCFKCHDGTNNVQGPAFDNYNYSKTFGGAPTADFTNVYDAFNADASGGSSHDLAALLTWAETNHPEWGFTSSSNPCAICHNPHLDKRNSSFPQDPTYTAIRRPSEHASNPTNQWGDDTGETMYDNWTFYNSNPNYDTKYEAPYYKSIGGGDGYEPAGTFSTDGIKHPDYATLCLDCHSEINVSGTPLPIDWESSSVFPSKHGRCPEWGEGANNNCSGGHGGAYPGLDDPWPSYDVARVLSCLDCHEAHGSSSQYMLRTTMNGHTGLAYDVNDMQSTIDWCYACHKPGSYDNPGEPPLHCAVAGGCDPCRRCHRHVRWVDGEQKVGSI